MFKIYRLQEKARILAALKANGSILLCGDEGSGKTILMDAVCADLITEGYAIAVIGAPSTQRQMLISICEQLTQVASYSDSAKPTLRERVRAKRHAVHLDY